ncbi:phosphoribosyl 1,2-cyclic phosphodiesterase [Agaricicola taiwanensis]|uniref:Phosphoribosyl 1,2-cyclic phosphodiesterase n=1 Tax=Agaricicola taiwanensis TaxID=591372 RepID=A0A8J3DXI6_9RHOB|nr:MBL fold metallo-hydrolase [Agaricicola taiwanensis]GGE45708.1 phosphoribosyl 1,2-cyclic phosphodiesterase [Agaricicola taiwanensis]
MSLQVTILGCGSSAGVPRIGTGWGACDPGNPKNRRRRCSILVERTTASGVTRILVDTSPDLREQLLDRDVDWLDAVLITHDHADHIHGVDDLRPVALHMHGLVPTWTDDRTAAVMKARFGYLFETPAGSNYPPILAEQHLVAGEATEISGRGGGIPITPFDLHHGTTDALGFRFGDLAYTPDVNAIPDASLPFLENLDVWIIDALRPRPHPSHFSLKEALDWIERMKPRRAVLTNLHSDLDYEMLRQSLPSHIVPAYDGLVIETQG